MITLIPENHEQVAYIDGLYRNSSLEVDFWTSGFCVGCKVVLQMSPHVLQSFNKEFNEYGIKPEIMIEDLGR